MKRAVLDANVWVSAALRAGSAPADIVALIRAGHLQSILSVALIDQVLRALRRLHHTEHQIADADAEMRLQSTLVVPDFTLAVVTAKEPDDRVLQVAVAGKADVIVTGDRRHLPPLGSYAGIPILTPADFLTGHLAGTA